MNKKYILIAGVNGAGKSTLFRTVAFNRFALIKNGQIFFITEDVPDWYNNYVDI